MKIRYIILLLIISIIPNLIFAQSALITSVPTNGIGKEIASIHSYSSKTNDDEGPYNLLVANGSKKWCDNQTEEPWVIVSFTNIYSINQISFEDIGNKESGCKNIEEYWIYTSTTGTKDEDFTEVIHKTKQGELENKNETFDTPFNARYIKLKLKRPEGDNAIRLFSFKAYGSFQEKIDRGDLISVGKTILKFYDATQNRETPLNIIDEYKDTKWCFFKSSENDPYKYAVIDLERDYDISKFIVYDCKSQESDNNTKGCNIYISSIMPDLDLIQNNGDTNSCWNEVVNSDNEEDKNIKEYSLDNPMLGRYIKLVFPRDKTTGTSRIFDFEVYGKEKEISSSNADLNSLSVLGYNITPKFSKDIYEYTLNLAKETESITINAQPFNDFSTVKGLGEKSLSIGENKFTINVTAQDGITMSDYVINVIRSDKSAISSLKNISVSNGFMNNKFNSNQTYYEVDCGSDIDKVIINAEVDKGDRVEGIGEIMVENPETDVELKVFAESGDYKSYFVRIIKAQKNLISASLPDGIGKRVVNIYSRSNDAKDTESAYKLIIPERNTYNRSTSNKWCDNKTESPWVIFNLSDIYEISEISYRDGYLIENVKNTTGYKIYVSTTNTNDDAWTEVAAKADLGNISTKSLRLESPVNARYIKLELIKGGTAIWLYGVNIYGTFKEKISYEPELISVGKTILESSMCWSDRESAANLLDYNTNTHWAYNGAFGDGNIVIDLESQYKINKAVLIETNDFTTGYKIDISNDYKKWDNIVDISYTNDEDINKEVKEVNIPSEPSGRYIKLTIPKSNAIGWSRIKEFKVYGKDDSDIETSDINNYYNEISIYPNPVIRGNDIKIINVENAIIKIFDIKGSIIYNQPLRNNIVNTTNIIPGTYIIHIVGDSEYKVSKLIIK